MYENEDPRLLARCTSNAFALLSVDTAKPVTLFVARNKLANPELLTLPSGEMRQLALQDTTQQLTARRGNGTSEPFVPFQWLLARAAQADWQDTAKCVPDLYKAMTADPNLHLHIVFKADNLGLLAPADDKSHAIAGWQAKCAFNSIKEQAGGFRTCGRGISARILLGQTNIKPISFDLNP